MKYLNLLALLAFLLSAIVQYNDPDPILWIIIYLMATASCLLFFLGKPTRVLSGVTCAFSIIWIIFLSVELVRSPFPIEWDAVFMQTSMKTISVELVREIGGLAIVTVWTSILLIILGRK